MRGTAEATRAPPFNPTMRMRGVLFVEDERRAFRGLGPANNESAAKAAHSKIWASPDDCTLPEKSVASSGEPGVYREVSGTVPRAFDNARGCVECREKPNNGDVGSGGYFFGVRHLGAAFSSAGSPAGRSVTRENRDRTKRVPRERRYGSDGGPRFVVADRLARCAVGRSPKGARDSGQPG